MKHWPECEPPDEVGGRGVCICGGKGFATPSVAGNYESYCVSCGARMMNADKRCVVCIDCTTGPTTAGNSDG